MDAARTTPVGVATRGPVPALSAIYSPRLSPRYAFHSHAMRKRYSWYALKCITDTAAFS
jgi:hypothetical protein